MMLRLAVLFATASLLFADDAPRQRVQVVHTERAELPSGGLLRLAHSIGEVTVEGWDRAEVEITTIRSTKEAYSSRDRKKASGDLDQVRVSTARKGDELVITTAFPHHMGTPWGLATTFDLEYRIKMPRNARLAVDHGSGEVHVDNLASDIQVRVRNGMITALLPEAKYQIGAKAAVGDVTSDFPGQHKRTRLLGHEFVQPAGTHKLNLKVGYGDIAIFRIPKQPASPGTL